MNLNPLRVFCVTGLFLLAFPFSSLAQTKVNSLAVLDVSVAKGVTLTPEERRGISDVVRATAAKVLTTSWTVFSSDQVVQKVPAASIQANCSDECMLQAGRKVQADFVIGVTVSQATRNIQITLKLFEVSTGSVKGTKWSRGPSAGDMIELLEGATEDLLGKQSGGRRSYVALKISTQPPGAFVKMDSAMFCAATPCENMILPGSHVFVLKQNRYQDTTFRVHVVDGGERTIVMRPGASTYKAPVPQAEEAEPSEDSGPHFFVGIGALMTPTAPSNPLADRFEAAAGGDLLIGVRTRNLFRYSIYSRAAVLTFVPYDTPDGVSSPYNSLWEIPFMAGVSAGVGGDVSLSVYSEFGVNFFREGFKSDFGLADSSPRWTRAAGWGFGAVLGMKDVFGVYGGWRIENLDYASKTGALELGLRIYLGG
jgi:hypothetical protein